MAKSTILTHTRGLALRATAPAREGAHFYCKQSKSILNLESCILNSHPPPSHRECSRRMGVVYCSSVVAGCSRVAISANFLPLPASESSPAKRRSSLFFRSVRAKKTSRARVGYARVWNFYVYLRDVLYRKWNAQNEINLKNLNKL